MPQNLTDDKSTLFQVMAWCRQAVRHQAITWTSVDQDFQRHMASLGPNELMALSYTKQLHHFWESYA